MKKSRKRFLIAGKTLVVRLTLATVAVVVVACGINPANAAAGLSLEQQKLFNKHILMFNWKDQLCGGGVGGGAVGGGGGAPTGPAIWNSGLQPPYILEQFAIETIKAIAGKRGVPADTVVTEEHVIGLVAFMLGEGGDIANTSSIFNPLNTGLNHKELLSSNPAADGTQSFKSFDYGVEGTARTMVGGNQSRLADVLMNPTSNAQQFMEALSFWNRYPGNHPWAEISRGREAAYYQERLKLIDQVRAKYADIAGLIIGTHELEQEKRMTDKSKLTYGRNTGGGGPGGPSGSNQHVSCSVGNPLTGCDTNFTSVVAGEVLSNAAKCLAWPNEGVHVITPAMMVERGGDGGKSKAKPPYVIAMETYNKHTHTNPYSDCGVFTATVIRATGVDPQYTGRSTVAQAAYVRNNPTKWKVIENVIETGQLQPGDILISAGHTYIFTGPWTGEVNPATGKPYSFNSAQASLAWTSNGTPPEGQNFWRESGYIAARFIGTPSPNPGLGAGGNQAR